MDNDPTNSRFDVLGRTDRAGLFWESDLRDQADPMLQALVGRASEELGMPIALVSLITDRAQVFRAQVGLPDDLARAGATDRDVSFCQVAVRDQAPLVVENAVGDPRVPQDLVARYGIRSYLGTPLMVDGDCLGTLCVLDVEEHGFAAEDLARLQVLRDLVQARLEALRRPGGVDRERLSRAAAPTFAELRNVLTVLSCSVAGARMAQAELGPALRTLGEVADTAEAPSALGALRTTVAAREDLQGCLDDLDAGLPRVIDAVLALQRATVRSGGGRCSLRAVVEDALALALHHTKLLGPLQVSDRPPEVELALEHSAAVATLASLLSTVALASLEVEQPSPLRVAVAVDESFAEVRVRSSVGRAALLVRLTTLFGGADRSDIEVDEAGDAVLRLPVGRAAA